MIAPVWGSAGLARSGDRKIFYWLPCSSRSRFHILVATRISSLVLHIAPASWSPRLTAQLYDVRRDQQLAGRAGQPDGSPFLLFELGCEIVAFATHNSQIFVLLPSCLVRAVSLVVRTVPYEVAFVIADSSNISVRHMAHIH